MSVARFNGGPLDGQTRMAPDEAGWPLPDEFALALVSDQANFAIGLYRKTNESQLPDEVLDSPRVLRGAEYAWVA